jgi:hypothetical protein
MAVHEHVRATAHFKLGPAALPVEEATCTLNFRAPALDGWDGVDVDLANAIHDKWSAFVTSADSQVSNDVGFDHVRLYKIDTTGHTVGDVIESTNDPVRGVLSTLKHPWQCTLCVTLDAGHRGKGRFGRIYLPPMGMGMTTDGLVDLTQRDEILVKVHELLDGLHTLSGYTPEWGLMISGRTGTAGTLRPVESIRLGRVVDTQRRRRRQLAEAYAVSELTAYTGTDL